MSDRFFHADPPQDARITLSAAQAHHAANVMRFRVGQAIVIFDGRGTEHQAEIETLSKRQLTAKVLTTQTVDRALSRPLSIAVALPKGDRQKFLVEKLVELGVQTLIPLKTSRSVAEVNTKSADRIKKQIIEASKQCRRNTLMRLTAAMSVTELAESPSALLLGQAEPVETSPTATDVIRLVADPYCDSPLSQLSVASNQGVVIAIGPEGGFDDAENAQLQAAGWQPTQLGSTILRIETAAVAAAAVLGLGR